MRWRGSEIEPGYLRAALQIPNDDLIAISRQNALLVRMERQRPISGIRQHQHAPSILYIPDFDFSEPGAGILTTPNREKTAIETPFPSIGPKSGARGQRREQMLVGHGTDLDRAGRASQGGSFKSGTQLHERDV